MEQQIRSTEPGHLIIGPRRGSKTPMVYGVALIAFSLSSLWWHWSHDAVDHGAGWGTLIEGLALTSFGLWDRRRRGLQLELDRAGFTVIDRRGGLTHWPWSRLGLFRRGDTPFSVEAAVREGDPARLMLRETDFETLDPLHVVLNQYRAGLGV